MEKKLVKGALYGLIVGILLGILIIPDTETVRSGNGAGEIRILPMREYVLDVLRFAIKAAFAAAAAVGALHVLNKNRPETIEFAKGFVKSFVIVFTLILLAMAVFFLISGG